MAHHVSDVTPEPRNYTSSRGTPPDGTIATNVVDEFYAYLQNES